MEIERDEEDKIILFYFCIILSNAKSNYNLI